MPIQNPILTKPVNQSSSASTPHAKWYYVGRQVDGATPQPVQKMTFEGLLRFVAKQKRLAGEVHTCYEAGPFGYHLHRKLTAMGVTNYVVQPRVWDERSKGVKTDKLDALALCQRLDRFALGNRKAFSIVAGAHQGRGTRGRAPRHERKRSWPSPVSWPWTCGDCSPTKPPPRISG